MRWYAWQLSQDAYVIGAVSFGWGALDPNWHNFRDDIDDDRLRVFMAAQLTLPRAPFVPVPPAPQPSTFFTALKQAIPSAVDLTGSLPQHPTARYATRDLAQITEIDFHHSGPPSDTGYTPQQAAAYHVSLGWPGIGYHAWIDTAGILSICNLPEVISYHVGSTAKAGDENLPAYGLCYPGTNPVLTSAQQITTLQFCNFMADYLGRKLKLQGHKDVAGDTDCPGANIMAFVTKINAPAPVKYTLEQLHAAAFAHLGAPGTNAYTPNYALQRAATERMFGAPTTPEFTFGPWTARGFALEIVYALTGDWGNIHELAW